MMRSEEIDYPPPPCEGCEKQRMHLSTSPNPRQQACTETRPHLHRFDDLLQHIRRRTSDRIRHDDDGEKARVDCRGLDYHRCDADIVLSVPASELLDNTVSVKEQAARDEPGRGEIQQERGGTVRKSVDGGGYRMEGEVDEQAASDWGRDRDERG